VSGRLFDLRSALDREAHPLVETTTSEDGTFDLQALPSGPVTLVVEARGFAPGLLATAFASEGQVRRALRVRLRRAVPLAGHVVDDEGREISGARIAVLSPMASVPQGASTDAKGRFRLEGMARKAVTLRVLARGFVEWKVTVGPDQGDLEIRLARKVAQEGAGDR